MSLFLQCLLYFIGRIISALSRYILPYVGKGYGVAVLVLSIGLAVVCSVLIAKQKKRFWLYLDFPLMYLCYTMIAIYSAFAKSRVFLILSAVFITASAVILTVRAVKFIIKAIKTRQTLSGKSVTVICVYIIAVFIVQTLLYADFDAMKYTKPTAEEIAVVDECRAYAEEYGETLPADLNKVNEIYSALADVDEELFFGAFSKSDYKVESRSLTYFEKNIAKNRRFTEIVALKLRCAAVLGKEAEYKECFLKNSDKLISEGIGTLFYAQCWLNESEEYKTAEVLDLITDGFDELITHCENDADKSNALEALDFVYSVFDTPFPESYKNLKLKGWSN